MVSGLRAAAARGRGHGHVRCGRATRSDDRALCGRGLGLAISAAIGVNVVRYKFERWVRAAGVLIVVVLLAVVLGTGQFAPGGLGTVLLPIFAVYIWRDIRRRPRKVTPADCAGRLVRSSNRAPREDSSGK